ncbi:MAG: response regulator [Anaerolineae bacterium]|nr:response regulator [Anaerolineae bacterium]
METSRAETITGKILIVDDTPSNLEYLDAMLSRRGCEVRTAQDGASALEMCADDPPDLVLLDVRMPEMDGYEVCRILKNDEETSDIPVIFLSAQSALGDIIQGFKVGGVDYISKPAQAMEVLARVQTHLSMHSLQRQLAAQNTQLSHEVAVRQQAEAALQKANEELESRVAERTAELARANADLQASIEIYRYLFEQTQDGYLIVDAQDRVLYINPQAQLYLGLQEAPKNQTFLDIAGKTYHCEPKALWALWGHQPTINATSRGSFQAPLYLVRSETPTSRAFWLHVSALNVSTSESEPVRRVIQLRDVTEKTALQDELSKFHSMIMHKLRTPLVPLYSGLQFLVSNATTLPREDMDAFLSDAFVGIERLHSEIEDIIQYLDAPNVAQGDAAFDLINLPAIIERIGADLSLNDVQLTGMEDVAGVAIPLSQAAVEVIFWEVLENAKKFHPRQSPRVRVQATLLETRQVQIRIQDNGVALSPEQLTHMWLPYYQGDKYATGQIAGMGLGLSLVATQIWSIGGTCRAFNREDAPGVVVELTLPVS